MVSNYEVMVSNPSKDQIEDVRKSIQS